MATSIYPKATKKKRLVDSGAVAAGQKITLRLNKDHLIDEFTVDFAFALTYGVAPTAYIAAELGKLIDKIRLSISGPQGKTWYDLGGILMYHHSSLFENQAAPVVDLAAGTVKYSLDLHLANDETRQDLISCLMGKEATGVDLEITLASLAIMDEAFTSAAAPTAASANVEAYSNEFDEADYAAFEEVGRSIHRVNEQNSVFAGAATQRSFLEVDNMCRGILFAVQDTGTAKNPLADGIVTTIDLKVRGVEVLKISWDALRQHTAKYFGKDVPGIAFYEFSDEELGFLNLMGVKQVGIDITANAACLVRIGQDMTLPAES